jgi:hypothetical protein
MEHKQEQLQMEFCTTHVREKELSPQDTDRYLIKNQNLSEFLFDKLRIKNTHMHRFAAQ